MDLWIRSQDKELLTKVIDIYKQADTNEIWAYSDKGVKNCLGFYATKKRALEILDEISDELISANYMPLEENEKITCGSARVYEMPKE